MNEKYLVNEMPSGQILIVRADDPADVICEAASVGKARLLLAALHYYELEKEHAGEEI